MKDTMKFDSPIAAAAKRMMMLLETGYLNHTIARDIRTLMEGAMAFEVVKAGTAVSSQDGVTS